RHRAGAGASLEARRLRAGPQGPRTRLLTRTRPGHRDFCPEARKNEHLRAKEFEALGPNTRWCPPVMWTFATQCSSGTPGGKKMDAADPCSSFTANLAVTHLSEDL